MDHLQLNHVISLNENGKHFFLIHKFNVIKLSHFHFSFQSSTLQQS